MKLTKYAHACIVLEEQGKKLVIDPGEYTKDFGDVQNVVAVVVTHVHGDHFNPEHLQAIIGANPDVKIFATPEVAEASGDPHVRSVKAGEMQDVAPFHLRFYGEKHAEIHAIKPVVQNIGVLVNNTLYYPGDSYTQPDQPVKVLALPAGAPWLKVGEAIDFMKTVAPTNCAFRTHDALLSADGKTAADSWFTLAADKFGLKYQAIADNDSVEI